jgi:hypothetical protein
VIVKLDFSDPAIKSALISGLSPGRFAHFRRDAGGNDLDALRLYLWNTAIAAAFYTPLQVLEVALRDAINRELSADHGELWWQRWDIHLDWRALQQIDIVTTRLAKRKQPATSANVIASLTFGFWTKMLAPGPSNIYEQHFWRKSLYRAFSRAKKDKALRSFTRVEIFKPINELNEFRNRVAHHVPIYHESLVDQFALITRVCRWLGPSSEALLSALDTCTPLLSALYYDKSTDIYRVDQRFMPKLSK